MYYCPLHFEYASRVFFDLPRKIGGDSVRMFQISGKNLAYTYISVLSHELFRWGSALAKVRPGVRLHKEICFEICFKECVKDLASLLFLTPFIPITIHT